MIHRVDGPIGAYRGRDDGTDRRIQQINQELADVTVFQSRYSLDAHKSLGLDFKQPVAIMNAVDPGFFFPDSRRGGLDKRKVRLISSSWSSNPNKGAATYQWLDKNLDWARFEYTFVGRSEASFQHIRVVPPVASRELADLLRQHDIYIAASLHDPCSNALLEALACGLPAIYAESGGHPEIVGGAGFGFSASESIPALLERLVHEYEERRRWIAIPTLAHVATQYLSVMGLPSTGHQLPEVCGDTSLSLADQWRYFAYGLRQIVQSIGRQFPVEPASVNLGHGDVQAKIEEGASPLRVYTIAMGRSVLPNYVGAEGPVCDVGCGAGGHSRFFNDSRSRHIYIGLDAVPHPSWSVQADSGAALPRRFVQMTASNLGLATNSLAFMFSSSALEHIDDLDRAIGELARAMRSGAYGLHIVPGVWSLFLYLLHGYRRFSAGGLAELFSRAGLKVERVWSLGGLPSFFFHCLWLTLFETIVLGKVFRFKGQIRKGMLLRLYSWLLRLSLRADAFLPFAPAGYAVLIRKL
jgi:SAM-dependent methyltransferase